MTDDLDVHIKRAQKCSKFAADHSGDLSATPTVSGSLKTALDAQILKTLQDDALAEHNPGFATAKSNLRTLAENSCITVSAAIESYADDVDDSILGQAFSASVSAIQGFHGNKLVTYGLNLYAKASASPVQAALIANHNVSAGDITDLQTNINNFLLHMGDAEEQIKEASGYNKLVHRDVDEINAMCEKMNKKMKTYRLQNPTLFNIWQGAFALDDQGSHSGSIKTGTVDANGNKSITVTYDSGEAITLQSTGTTKLEFQLTLAGVLQGTPTTVNAGESLSMKMGDLGTTGDAIRIHNTDSAPGTFAITFGE